MAASAQKGHSLIFGKSWMKFELKSRKTSRVENLQKTRNCSQSKPLEKIITIFTLMDCFETSRNKYLESIIIPKAGIGYAAGMSLEIRSYSSPFFYVNRPRRCFLRRQRLSENS